MLISALCILCIWSLFFTASWNDQVADYATLIFWLSFGTLLTALVMHW
jgi:hypothetical protein